ncbi:MAG TPA: T9SS type A sorting domain-containing protein, partial [Bacteroidota bacterium]|nr:T9SS type A sorting domain-containing protein [Bacteroidota bacterium]
LWLTVNRDGILGYDTLAPRGMTYPLFEGGVLSCDNLIWSGKVLDGQTPVIRTGGGKYAGSLGVLPGSIADKGAAEDPQSDAVRVYRYRPDYSWGDLSFDAAAVNGAEISKVTPDMISSLRESYRKDAVQWPWQKGAPFIDKNHNGVMDYGEQPGIENASQLAWLCYNDLNPIVSRVFAGDPPIGLEVQLTVWAYKGAPNLDDVIFKRYRIIYKGTSLTPSSSHIDSMYISQWSDPDIGSASLDLAGCDTNLNLGYVYHGTYQGNDQDRVYAALQIPTPAVGYALLQGPIVPAAGGSSGTFKFGQREGWRNLPMTSFAAHIVGLGDALIPTGTGVRTFWWWNVLRGFNPLLSTGAIATSTSSVPWKDPEGKPTAYMYYGDPVTQNGWTAARPYANWSIANADWLGGDASFFMNMGPFSMAVGDTQEVVVAIIASAAPTSLENVTWLRHRADYVRTIYPNLGDYVAQYVTGVSNQTSIPLGFSLEQNYPNPFNPSTRIQFNLASDAPATLEVRDLLGRPIKQLVHGFLLAGTHSVWWEGRSSADEIVPSGVYFYTLTQGGRQLTKKMILIR